MCLKRQARRTGFRAWPLVVLLLSSLPACLAQTTIAAGSAHSLRLFEDGTVWAWGWNEYGQVGDGTTTDRSAPVPVSGLTRVVAVAAGDNFSLAVRNDGTVWAWGDDGMGQLGDGTTAYSRIVPLQVNEITGAVKVAAGHYHSLALRSDGTVWAWGSNNSGQLGDGSWTNRSAPVQVSGLTSVVAVAAGYYFSLAVKSDGTVWGWGDNGAGELGDGTQASSNVPVQVIGLKGVLAVGAGDNHSLALKSDGTVWTWGGNVYGQLGDGTGESKTGPVQVSGLTGVIAVAGGFHHSLAAKSDGTTWAWGNNEYGQLGDGTQVNRNSPVRVNGLDRVAAIAAGYNHNLALVSNGRMLAWGNNSHGQLGDGMSNQLSVPVQVNGLSGVVSLAGGYHNLALKTNGTVWAWGANGYGQIGDGTTTQRDAPVQASDFTTAVAGKAGWYHSLVVKSDGTVWSFGWNGCGQLGDGSVWDRGLPVQVAGLSGVANVAAGYCHSVAVKGDGTVWTWGGNEAGELGDGTTNTAYAPVRVNGIPSATAVAAGYCHSLALASDGTVWTWGCSNFGQLGDGTRTSRSVPARVTGLNGVVGVAALSHHNLALRRDGTVWAWGYNSNGQLGDGTTTDQTTPVQVSGLSGAASVAAGYIHSMAVKKDGTVWAWGGNGYGQLGDGTAVDRALPVQVTGLSGVVGAAAGLYHGLALRGDGAAWAWGGNWIGQLGKGSSLVTPSPVQTLPGGPPDLGIEVRPKTTFRVGNRATYSLTVTNNGSLPAIGITTVTDAVDIVLGVVSATGPGWYCSVAGQVVTCANLGPLAGGASSEINLTVAIGSAAFPSVSNAATVSNSNDTNATNNTDSVLTAVLGPINMSVNPSAVTFGATYDRRSLTPPQQVTLNFSGGVLNWSASSDRAWLQVSPGSGSGAATITLSLDANALPTSGNDTAMVLISAPGALRAIPLFGFLSIKTTSNAPFGAFDTPAPDATGLASNIPVTGWALDDIGIDKVTLWRDPVGNEPRHANGLVYIADAVFVPDARPDVAALYPYFPLSNRAGWGYLMLTNFLPNPGGGASGNGTHKIHAYAADLEGNETLLGSKTITLDNANSTKPFGTIDTPAQGETVSGTTYVNFGWALTPQPNLIPTDGSTLWVVVDGALLAHPFYNQYRVDIATAFPNYANSGGAVGYYLLDTTAFSNGMHNIAWVVTDNGGRQDGIGSRYFWVQNQFAAQGAGIQSRLEEEIETPETVSFRIGYGINAALKPVRAAGDGLFETLELDELNRIEVHLPGAGPWHGGLLVDGELHPLPVGSALDETKGVFYWQLGPGFLGEYTLEFSHADGASRPIQLPVRIRTRHTSSSSVTSR
jgi:uncharacterized repeat protein (TIGR01451 family)